MKTLLLLPVLLFTVFRLSAAILTVNNTTPNAAQFSSISAAIAAASAGDTIYLQPTGVSYGDINLVSNKPLVFIGGGFAPLIGSLPATIANGIGANAGVQNNNYSDNVFIGIRFTSGLNYSIIFHQPIVHNLTFIRCAFTGFGIEMSGPCCNNWLMIQCVFSPTPNNSSPFGTFSGNNHLFINTVFVTSTLNQGQPIFNQFSATNTQFINCSFYRSTAVGANYNFAVFSGSPSSNFQNCIFDSQINLPGTPLSFTFENSLASGPAGPTTAAFLNSRSVFEDNIEGTAVYANYTPNAIFNINSTDMTLQTGSPGIGAGMDGFDVGPFGGNAGFVKGGLPPLPFIEQAVSLNVIVPADQTLQIKVKAQVQN